MVFQKNCDPENTPAQTKNELTKVIYNQQISLTNSLKRQTEIDKDITMKDLTLARANIDAIIEKLAKIFLAVLYRRFLFSIKK